MDTKNNHMKRSHITDSVAEEYDIYEQNISAAPVQVPDRYSLVYQKERMSHFQRNSSMLSREERGKSILKEESPNKVWILYASLSAIFMTGSNVAISEITSKVGPLCLLYFAVGPILSGLVFDLCQSFKNMKKPGGKCWVDQNMVRDGRVLWKNIFGFIVFCILYALIMNLAFVTMWFCDLANINVGVITMIWSVSPLFMSVADYFIFGQNLRYYHLIGTILIIGCAIVLSLQSVIEKADKVDQPIQPLITKQALFPTWVLVLFSLLLPLIITLNSIAVRKLTIKEYGIGFHGPTLSFNCFLFVNIIILAIAIWYWVRFQFSFYLFWVGTLGGIFNTAGQVFCNKAWQHGPLGPVYAISALSNILLVIVEALKHQRLPTQFEFIALALGLGGALEMAIPEIFRRLLCPCFCRDIKEDNVDTLIEHQERLSMRYKSRVSRYNSQAQLKPIMEKE